ncbi:hypothetical protein BC937DRAFT_89384 [Endogone sp. FLAS-F59071]|nr:hypothetical protein BC937DRAFT_89384 [Endogone sp. FLAS-F59071]|eukprot:RUS17883.1 hypothetical protein BC937DRAFT_89384 [Endogone sp. FLAS-F59071]
MQFHTVIINLLNSRQHLGSLLLSLLLLLLVGNALSQSTNSSNNSSSTTTFRPKSGVTIGAYDDYDRLQYNLTGDDLLIYNVTYFPLINSVAYYIVGTGPTRLEVRAPFGGGDSAPTMAAALQIVNDFVYLNRTISNVDMINVKMDASNWSNITSNLCEESPPTLSSPCPDVIFLGTTEIAGLAASSSIVSLEGFFDQYTQTNSWALKDSFSKVRTSFVTYITQSRARLWQTVCRITYTFLQISFLQISLLQFTYYDYTYEGDWYAVPLTADIRILFYNTTTFKTLGLSPPPPNGNNWGSDWWETWNWSQFVQYANIIGNSGLGYGFTFSGDVCISGYRDKFERLDPWAYFNQ